MKKAKDIFLIFLFTIILLEVSLQLNYYICNGALLFHRIKTPIYTKDQDYGHRVKSNLIFNHVTNEFNVTYYTNSKGFRCSSKLEEYNKLGNEYRIILNGPSFAFGWGVNYEQSFAALLENTLKSDSVFDREGVKVINFGVPSRSIPIQIKFLEKEGRNYKPSLVVQLAYGSMTMGKHDQNKFNEVKNGFLINEKSGFGWIIDEMKQSGIVFYLWITYNKVLSFSNKNNNDSQIIGAGRDLSVVNRFDINDKMVSKSLKYYFDLQLYCQSINAKLLIVFFPLSYVVHGEDVNRWKHLGVKNIPGEIAFNKEYCDYLIKNGIDCLNMTDDLIYAANVSHKKLYYWLDVHWTPYGNEVAAKLVSQYLLKQQSSRRIN